MMLGGQDEACETAGASGGDPLPAVEFGRSEDILGLVAVSPLTVGERVDGEMNETVKRPPMPGELPCAGYRTVRCRHVVTFH
jgi:hypothetical protein